MMEDFIKNAKFLIVDDELANLRLLERTLERWGYFNVESTTDPEEAITLFTWSLPDIVLLDLAMPEVDGFSFLDRIKPLIPADYHLPVIVLTADVTPATRRKALSAGAKDFLTKPFDQMELLLRIWNLLETRYFHVQLQEQNRTLEQRVQERTQELEEAQLEILERLAQAAEYRDDDTGQHTQRVAALSALIAQELGLDAAEIELIRQAAPFHDVGKIGVSDSVLLKPDKLTVEEFELIKVHTTIGAGLLSGGRSEVMQMAECIALSHHERWDGRGYPYQLKGEDIPLPGRIVCLADVFDALTNERPYKTPWPVDEAIAEIIRQAGRQFDPRIVSAFQRVMERQNIAVAAA